MSQSQINFGKINRDAGIKKAINHANTVSRNWEERAFNFFVNVFLKNHKGAFQCEDFRASCKGVIPDPPSLRSYGALIKRARTAGLIEKGGEPKAVKNPKAQMAFAAVWKSTIIKQ